MQPVEGPAVWRGADLGGRDWIVTLDEGDCDALLGAARALAGRRLDTLTRADFEAPRLDAKLAAAGRAVAEGTGFVLLRGLPAAGLPRDLLEIVYWGVGTHLGVGVSQSAAGDRLGEVYDRGTNDKERYYTRGGALEFHMDPVDIVGLLCLRPARAGGASRIVSAGAVHNAILAERPDLAALLYRGFHNSRRGHGEAVTGHRVPVFAPGPRGLECYLLPQTIRQATEEGFPLDPAEAEALDYLAATTHRPELWLDMDFRPGDIQFLNNRTVLHSRTDYEDDPDPAKRRLLLRLWLMAPDWPPRPAAMNLHGRVDQAGGGVRPAAEPAPAG
jgi:hypothetical protein